MLKKRLMRGFLFTLLLIGMAFLALPVTAQGPTKDQVLTGINQTLDKADKAFYSDFSTDAQWHTLIDDALTNYQAALDQINANKDNPDFATDPAKTTFLTAEYRALAGKARTEVRKSFTADDTAYLEFRSIIPPTNSEPNLTEADTQTVRADLEAAVTLGATFSAPPKELGWVYYNWALAQYPLGELHTLNFTITNPPIDDQYAAYQHYGEAAKLLSTAATADVAIEAIDAQSKIALALGSYADQQLDKKYQGLNSVQWWKTAILDLKAEADIGVHLQNLQPSGDGGYCAAAMSFSQTIANGAIQDPDGRTLAQWLQEELQYCIDTPYSLTLVKPTIQAQLAWLNRDPALAQLAINAASPSAVEQAINTYASDTFLTVLLEHNLGKAYLLVGNPVQALDLLMRVRQTIDLSFNWATSGDSYFTLVNGGEPRGAQDGYDNEWLIGKAYVQLSRYQEALTQLNNLNIEVPNYVTNQIYPESQEDLADAYLGLNRYNDAIPPLENSRKAYQTHLTDATTNNDTDGIRIARLGLIDLTLRLSLPLAVLGRTEEAVTTLEQALDEANKTDDATLKVNTSLRVGDVYLQLQKDDDALRNYQAAADLAASAKLPQQQGRALLGVGQILGKRGQLDTARTALTKAVSAAQTAGDFESQVQALTSLGDLALQGTPPDTKTAQTFYTQALTAATTSKNPRLLVQPLTALGDLQAKDTPNTAQFTYYRAISAALQVDDRESQARLYARIGALAGVNSDTFNADTAYKNAIQVVEQAQRGFKSETLTSQFAANYAPIYADYLKLLFEQKRYADAFTVSEQARARAFLDQLAVGPVDYRQGSSADLLQKANDLRVQLDTLHTLETQAENDTQSPADVRTHTLTALGAAIQQAEHDYTDVFTQMQAQSPELDTLTGIHTLSVAQVQAQLDPDTTLISYYTLDSVSYVFLITHNTLDAVSLPVGQAQLAQWVNLFRDDEKQGRGLKELGAAILTPLVDKITTKHVIVVPHNVLNYMPFAALPLADGTTLFGDKFVVSYLPSASSLSYLAKIPAQPGKLFALGNPTTADLPPLQFAEDEVKQAVDLVGGQDFTEKDATLSLLQQDASSAGILYIAAHGTFNDRNPLFSALHLASSNGDDGLLEAYKIYSLDLTQKTELVVLSACDTAVGVLSAGDDFTGLNRAFLYAGSPAVIATLWSVDDKATGLLMKTFFEMRAKGQSNSQALQSAQAFIRTYQENGQTPYASPYYWAAFTLTGRE